MEEKHAIHCGIKDTDSIKFYAEFEYSLASYACQVLLNCNLKEEERLRLLFNTSYFLTYNNCYCYCINKNGARTFERSIFSESHMTKTLKEPCDTIFSTYKGGIRSSYSVVLTDGYTHTHTHTHTE